MRLVPHWHRPSASSASGFHEPYSPEPVRQRNGHQDDDDDDIDDDTVALRRQEAAGHYYGTLPLLSSSSSSNADDKDYKAGNIPPKYLPESIRKWMIEKDVTMLMINAYLVAFFLLLFIFIFFPREPSFEIFLTSPLPDHVKVSWKGKAVIPPVSVLSPSKKTAAAKAGDLGVDRNRSLSSSSLSLSLKRQKQKKDDDNDAKGEGDTVISKPYNDDDVGDEEEEEDGLKVKAQVYFELKNPNYCSIQIDELHLLIRDFQGVVIGHTSNANDDPYLLAPKSHSIFPAHLSISLNAFESAKLIRNCWQDHHHHTLIQVHGQVVVDTVLGLNRRVHFDRTLNFDCLPLIIPSPSDDR